MTIQTSYPINHAVGLPGAIADLHAYDSISLAVEESELELGIACSRGTAEGQVVAGGSSFVGISMKSYTSEGAANGDLKYKINETAAIMRKGYIFAICANVCEPGDTVFYTDATGALSAGTAGADQTQINATWETTAAAGEIAILRVND